MSLNLGIEYELEGIVLDDKDYSCPGWLLEEDGTLRDYGMEFILRRKMPVDRTKQAIENLLTTIEDDYLVSHRCSTHIHVDVTGMHDYGRISLLLGLIAHDRHFFSYGIGREANNFCCPVLYSPAAIGSINQAFKSYSWDSNNSPSLGPLSSRTPTLTEDDTKYMSINTMPLRSQGSIELRHFHPLMTMRQVVEVIDTIEEIYNVASSVPKNGRAAASEVWTRYGRDKPELQEAIEWTQIMYKTHNLIAEGA